jgi:hypothetical protein
MQPKRQIQKHEAPAGTMGVLNNDARLINLPPCYEEGPLKGQQYKLVPGMNYLPTAYAEWVQTHPDVADMCADETSQDKRTPLLVFGAAGRKLIPDTVRDTLADLPETDAISIIKDANEAGCAKYATTEKRTNVKLAISARLKELSGPKA